MSNIIGYVTYRLRHSDGAGYSPYQEVASVGCEFDGGYFTQSDGTKLGYILGSSDTDIDSAIAICGAYNMTRLTAEQACEFADLASAPGRMVKDIGTYADYYVHPAIINMDGKVTQQFVDTPPADPNVNLLSYYKRKKIEALLGSRELLQKQGMTTTNGIHLQAEEKDLSRWTQLTAILSSFHPVEAQIRDYNNVVHTVSFEVAMQMMGEVAAWGQAFLVTTWQLKDAIEACTTLEQLNAL